MFYVVAWISAVIYVSAGTCKQSYVRCLIACRYVCCLCRDRLSLVLYFCILVAYHGHSFTNKYMHAVEDQTCCCSKCYRIMLNRNQKIAPFSAPVSLCMGFHGRIIRCTTSIIDFVSLAYEHASYELIIPFRVILVIRINAKLVVPVGTESTTACYE